MTDRLRRFSALLVLGTLSLVFIFGVCKQVIAVNHLNHSSGMNAMSAVTCATDSSACVSSPTTEHMAIFTSAFPAVETVGFALLLVGFFLFYRRPEDPYAIHFATFRQRLKTRVNLLAHAIAPPELQFAFSHGILHPKKDA